MDAPSVDLTNQRFGRLTVLSFVDRLPPQYVQRWLCLCDCGKKRTIAAPSLKLGKTQSCGCLQKDRVSVTARKHGLADSPEYKVWTAMKQRCYHPNEPAYENYGARGIEVCPQWRGSDSFSRFITDMGRRPSARHTIERKDNDGDYTPDNCIWATRAVQTRNQRNTRLITIDGETKCLSDWLSHSGVTISAFHGRVERGWPMLAALIIPLGARGYHSRRIA